MNRQGRPTAAGRGGRKRQPDTFTGNRGLASEEPLIFELGRTGQDRRRPAGAAEVRRRGSATWRARAPIGLPGLSEPEAVRHYVRLQPEEPRHRPGLYPLGSCTMKHNPRLNEKMARLPGFADIHPLQPHSTVQGALALIAELAHWLTTLTGMPAVAMTPKAGAHGELCGLLAIQAALEARGETRSMVLVPKSAHGTNPATAALLGYRGRDRAGTRRRHGRSGGAEKRQLGPTSRRSWSPTPTPAACSSAT